MRALSLWSAAVLFCLMVVTPHSASNAQDTDDPHIIRDTFISGTTGNAAIFRILNDTGERITGVKMTPSFPLQWIALTGITPETTDLAPGEIAEFEIEFLIFADAPDGATEAVTLFFNANEDVEIRNPQYTLVIDIAREIEEVHFLLSVEGQGFVPVFDVNAKPRTVDADGTVWIGQSGAMVGREVAGLHEVWMTLRTGEDHDRLKEDHRKYLLSRVCHTEGADRDDGLTLAPTLQAGSTRSPPSVWQRGPKIVTVAGPFSSREEYSGELRKTWRAVGEAPADSTHLLMDDLVSKAKSMTDCGGECCAVRCEDPFRCD